MKPAITAAEDAKKSVIGGPAAQDLVAGATLSGETTSHPTLVVG